MEEGGRLLTDEMPDGLPAISDVIGDATGMLAAIPAPIKRNLLKALGALITGLAEVPAAYLEMKAAKLTTKKKGHEVVMAAAARSAAAAAGKSPEITERALAYFANDLVRGQDNREAVGREALQAALSLLPPEPTKEIPTIDDDWLHQFRKLASSKSNV